MMMMILSIKGERKVLLEEYTYVVVDFEWLVVNQFFRTDSFCQILLHEDSKPSSFDFEASLGLVHFHRESRAIGE